MGIDILVVEDNEYKRKRIVEVIKSDFNDCIVTESYSFTSAWKFISEHVFDVILLDMSLPTFDKTDSDPGGVFRIFGGKELARKMGKRNVKSKFIFITQYKGPELGTIALLSNIMREIITLLCTPLLVRWFGNLAPISAGGATTMDTTLPIITRCSGQQFVVVSIFHGFVTDFSVPFLVTFFCSI